MSVLETWTLAPVPLLACLLAVALYCVGVSRTNRQGGSWPRWRTVLFVGVGLPLTVLTVTWWPGARSHQLFSAYMTQVVMLALIIPVVMVLGAPARLWREATNKPLGGEDKHRVLDSEFARAITHPLMTPLFMLALPVIVIFTPILLLTLENSVAYSAMQITLVVLGVIALLGLVGGQVPEHGIPHAAAAFIAFFELILDAIPGGVAWNDLRSSDPEAAREFYSALFGYHFTPIEMAGPDYMTFSLSADGEPQGGIGGMMGMDGFPSHWIVYLAVRDVDDAVAKASELGGQVISSSFDTPYGRMAALTDPTGASFWVMTFAEHS